MPHQRVPIPLGKLWTIDRRQCALTSETDGPPYTVVVWQDDSVFATGTYVCHDDAVVFAVSQMRAALRTSKPQPRAARDGKPLSHAFASA